MTISVKTESERLNEAVMFVKAKLEDIDRSIKECDYYEDVNGNLVYAPGSYAEEKREYQKERDNWDIMLNILTRKAPFSMCDW